MSKKMIPPNLPMNQYEPPTNWNDYHSLYTIQVCELYDNGFFDGFVEHSDDWDFPIYTEEQDKRLRQLILDYFFYREIGIIPPGIWKRKFLSRMRSLSPTYLMMYKIVDDAQEDLLQAAGTIHEVAKTDNSYKGRSIFSEFPETMLSANSDYASNGSDTEDERIIDKDIVRTLREDYMKRLQQLEEEHANVDKFILNKLESLFSSLLTSNVNGM